VMGTRRANGERVSPPEASSSSSIPPPLTHPHSITTPSDIQQKKERNTLLQVQSNTSVIAKSEEEGTTQPEGVVKASVSMVPNQPDYLPRHHLLPLPTIPATLFPQSAGHGGGC